MTTTDTPAAVLAEFRALKDAGKPTEASLLYQSRHREIEKAMKAVQIRLY